MAHGTASALDPASSRQTGAHSRAVDRPPRDVWPRAGGRIRGTAETGNGVRDAGAHGGEGLRQVASRRCAAGRRRASAARLRSDAARPPRPRGVGARRAPAAGAGAMKRPGDRLRMLASRVCQPHAMERLIDPVLADLQCEYAAAQTRGQVWRGRWIRLAGYVAFWKVFGMHTAVRTVPAARDWLAADDRAIGRALSGVTVVATVVTAVLMLPPLRMLIRTANDGRAYPPLTSGEMGWLFLYMIPAALTIGIALGVPFGVLWGLRGRVLSSRSR